MRSRILLLLFGLVVSTFADRVTATAHLNVRTGPGLEFGKVWVARPGTDFPLLGRDGEWLKVQLLQLTPGDGVGFFVDTAAAAAGQDDTLEVSHRNARGQTTALEFLPKSCLRLAGVPSRARKGGFFRVHVRREGWIYAGYAKPGESILPNKDGSPERPSGISLTLPAAPLKTINWSRLRFQAPLYLPSAMNRPVGKLDSGVLVQILGEDKKYVKIQVASADLKDTFYVDLNQFYDTNAGDTTTLVSGSHQSVQAVGAVRKDQVQFDPNRAFFGPGISRLVPVSLDLPLLVDAKATERLRSFEELAQALKGRKETHPGAFLDKEKAAALIHLASEKLDAVLAPKWFLDSDSGALALGLSLKTLATREAGRGPEEYFFHKYVRPILEAYRESLPALSPFRTLVIEVQYMDPGLAGSALRFKTLAYHLPLSALVDLDQGKTTYRDVFKLAAVDRPGGNS